LGLASWIVTPPRAARVHVATILFAPERTEKLKTSGTETAYDSNSPVIDPVSLVLVLEEADSNS